MQPNRNEESASAAGDEVLGSPDSSAQHKGSTQFEAWTRCRTARVLVWRSRGHLGDASPNWAALKAGATPHPPPTKVAGVAFLHSRTSAMLLAGWQHCTIARQPLRKAGGASNWMAAKGVTHLHVRHRGVTNLG